MNKIAKLTILVGLVILSACGSNPSRGLAARNGRDLAVEATYVSVPQTTQTTFTNADGSPGGTATSIVGYTQVRNGFEYKFDGQTVDEQDFYQLAAAQNIVARIKDARSKGIRYQRIGGAVALASVAAAIIIPSVAGIKTMAYSMPLGIVGSLTGIYFYVKGDHMVFNHHATAAEGFEAIGQPAAAWALPQQ